MGIAESVPHGGDQVFEHRVRLEVPVEDAFAWHQRPGALERLTPPWESVEVIQAPPAPRKGTRAVLRVPLGPFRCTWVAEHTEFVPGRRFRDVAIRGPFRRWDHTHEFVPDGPDACVLLDRIRYALPFGWLGRLLGSAAVRRKLAATFAYRSRILAQDLQRHRGRREPDGMKILVSGASGLVGRALVPFLTAAGHRVVRLVRRPARSADEAEWDPTCGLIDVQAAEGADAVVHLAGANIAEGRWTASRKELIRRSRVEGTLRLSESLERMASPPPVLVCASAIGFYGDRGDELVDEDEGPGRSFLSGVVREWEGATHPARRAGVRVVNLRLGVVLSPDGGALKTMLRPFRLGLGGRLGHGRQLMSWVAIDDVLGAVLHALETPELRGPVNVVAPHPVSNAEFTRVLGGVLGRPALFPVPAAAARLAFGEMADELLLASTGVAPRRLVETGYAFAWPRLPDALAHLLGRADGAPRDRADVREPVHTAG